MTEMLITAEHHGRIVRLLQHDIPVEVEMEVTNIFHGENLNDYNVIGEIPGTDKNLKDQVVMDGSTPDPESYRRQTKADNTHRLVGCRRTGAVWFTGLRLKTFCRSSHHGNKTGACKTIRLL